MIVALIVLLVVGHQAVLARARGGIDPLDATTLLDLVVLLICVYGAILDPEVGRLVNDDADFGLMLVGGIVALYAGLHWPGRTAAVATDADVAEPRLWLLWGGTALYVALSLQQLLFWAAGAGGIVAWLTGPRTALYGEVLEGGGGALASVLGSAARVTTLVLIVVMLRRGRLGTAAALYVLAFLCIFAVFTTRAEVVITLMLPVFYYHYAVRRLRLWMLVGTGTLGLLLLGALNVYRVVGTDIDLSEGLAFADIALSAASQKSTEYFAGPLVTLWKLRESGALHLEYGLNYLYLFVTFVPRALWPGKPVTSFENRWTVITQGGLTADGGSQVWVFTAWGEGLAQFGVAGAILNLFLYGLIVRWALRRARRRPEYILVLCLVSIFSAMYLRAGFQPVAMMAVTHAGTLLLVDRFVFSAVERRPIAGVAGPGVQTRAREP